MFQSEKSKLVFTIVVIFIICAMIVFPNSNLKNLQEKYDLLEEQYNELEDQYYTLQDKYEDLLFHYENGD